VRCLWYDREKGDLQVSNQSYSIFKSRQITAATTGTTTVKSKSKAKKSHHFKLNSQHSLHYDQSHFNANSKLGRRSVRHAVHQGVPHDDPLCHPPTQGEASRGLRHAHLGVRQVKAPESLVAPLKCQFRQQFSKFTRVGRGCRNLRFLSFVPRQVVLPGMRQSFTGFVACYSYKKNKVLFI